jgi:uncharacterized protein YndB with AHSA1/START domain
MPLKNEPPGRRALEMEFDLPGSPDEVWQAIATGSGYSAWFVPTQLEERVGGRLAFHFPVGFTLTGQVTVWQPPVRFAYEAAAWRDGAPPLATEITVEARSGGTCKVRMVHSLFTSKADWDDELDGMENDLQSFLGILRITMIHFRGLPVASAWSVRRFAGEHGAVWATLLKALSLSGVEVGQLRGTSANGAPHLVGVVERIGTLPARLEVTLRLEEPGPGVALFAAYDGGGQVAVMIGIKLFGGGAAAVLGPQHVGWDAWLANASAGALDCRDD